MAGNPGSRYDIKGDYMIRIGVVLILLWGCGPIVGNKISDEEEVEIIPPIENKGPLVLPSEIDCPNGTNLTYENFGEPFMLRYCVSCHSSQVEGDLRGGAPIDVNLDSPGNVAIWRKSILETSANDLGNRMPPQTDMVPRRDRTLLSEWIRCGAPGTEDGLVNTY